ncbi:MAG: hypothetical protein IKN59_02645 [Paludibacteraceae bacterium]|nr:hypothetical protein [Paludibacteraceae bacterium]
MKNVFKFTHIVAVAFAAVCMFSFSACNDEVSDNMTDLKTSLEKEVQDLQDQVDDMQRQISTITTCTCDFQKTIDLVNDSLKNYWNITQVQNYVNTQLNDYVRKTVYQAAIDSINEALDSINAHLSRHCDSISDLYVMYNTLNNAITTTNALANAANQLAKDDSVRIDLLTGRVLTLETNYDTLKGRVDTLDARYTTLNGKVTTIGDRVDTLDARYTNLNGRMTAAEGNITALDTRLTTAEGNIVTVSNRVDTLTTRMTSVETILTRVRDSVAVAYALAFRDSIRINALEQMYTSLHETDSLQQYQIDSIKTAILNFATHAEVNAVYSYADSLHNVAIKYAHDLDSILRDTLNTFDVRITTIENLVPIIRDSVKLLNDSIVALQAEVANLKTQVDQNTKDIAALTKVVDKVMDALTKSIYGVVIQGTFNPVFGYACLPFGIQSNVLMAYYGQNDSRTYFPTTRTSALVYEQYALTDEDAAMLGASMESFVVPGQTTFLGEGPNAGKIFFTVNPSTADLTDATFTLVDSRDNEAGITLDTVRPSTEKLTFGYTGPYNMNLAPVQGQSTNGLYEAVASLDEAGIPTAKISIDPQLKQAVKDFYNTNFRGKSGTQIITGMSASSFTELAQGIYQQFNGLCPRYAVKATWTDSLGQHDVYSEYGAAAVAVKPLSYAFLKDKTLGKLPNISPISDMSDFKINMQDIHFNVRIRLDSAHANIHLAAITLNLDTVDVILDVPDLNHYQATGEIVYIKDTVDLSELQNYFNDRFAQVITNWEGNINKAINEQVNLLITNINDQLRDFTDDVQGQLNSQIQKVMNDVQGQVMSKFNNYLKDINKVISKVNSVVNKVNRILDNPNKFMQPILVYEGKDHAFHIMSTRKVLPTVFTGSGAIILHPTSYNAEIVAPAYKKFIAVTNVYKNGTSAQDGDPACLAALNSVNSKPYFNEVIDGGRYGVPFVPVTGGFTYEIFYSALDYSGKISQRKYYVTVQ